MAMSFKDSASRLIAVAAVAALLAGCAPVDPGMGEAVKYDMFAQTVNPDPVYSPDALRPGYDGIHGQKATDRYHKDSVKAVVREQTGSGSGGGGGSSGGSGGGSGGQ
jgi:uncharacterized membrane protein YgcG